MKPFDLNDLIWTREGLGALRHGGLLLSAGVEVTHRRCRVRLVGTVGPVSSVATASTVGGSV